MIINLIIDFEIETRNTLNKFPTKKVHYLRLRGFPLIKLIICDFVRYNKQNIHTRNLYNNFIRMLKLFNSQACYPSSNDSVIENFKQRISRSLLDAC